MKAAFFCFADKYFHGELRYNFFILFPRERIYKGEGFMSQKSSGVEIRAEQRQSWLSIAMVWAGGMICVPCLMIGGVLVGGGLSF